MNPAIQEKIKALFDKKSVLIAVMDSGLGGLSICAQIERALQETPLFRQTSLIYFNVWPEQERGYNSLDSVSERVRVLDRALKGVSTYKPDLIMIACNTLSVIYDKTPFSLYPEIPVVDIVDFGVDLIRGRLIKIPDSQALILGTRTTISENVHRRKLIRQGIDARRIRTQACHGVATAIEKDPQGEAVVELIEKYAHEAMLKIGGQQTVLAALCCTHFTYSRSVFREKLREELKANIELVDPNTQMSDFMFGLGSQNRFAGNETQVKVISKIMLEHRKIESISGVIKNISKKAAEALVNYIYKPDLFEV